MEQSKDPLPSTTGPAEGNNHNTNNANDNEAGTNNNSLLPKKRKVPLPRPGELLIYDCRPPPSHTLTPTATAQETATFLLQKNDASLYSSSSPSSSGSNASAAQMAFASPPTTPMPAPQEATFTRDDSNTTDQGMSLKFFLTKRTDISCVRRNCCHSLSTPSVLLIHGSSGCSRLSFASIICVLLITLLLFSTLALLSRASLYVTVTPNY